jgi:hypothetical protein
LRIKPYNEWNRFNQVCRFCIFDLNLLIISKGIRSLDEGPRWQA